MTQVTQYIATLALTVGTLSAAMFQTLQSHECRFNSESAKMDP